MKAFLIAVLAAFMGACVEPCFAGDPFFQHADLTPSNIQGQAVLGWMHTNAGSSQVNELPIFYRNSTATDPWYKPSFSPLAIGWSVGGGNASGNAGSLIDFGPQLISAFEGGLGLFSSNAEASVINFFNCSASATACGALSAGLLANLTIEHNGQFSKGVHEMFAHPLGEFVGPSILFGGPGAVSLKRRLAQQ